MKDFRVDIEHVINGNIDSVKSNTLISPDEADKVIKDLGLERYDFDNNGWDYDFWVFYNKGDDKFVLSGSGWYNRGLTFAKYEEE